MAVDDTVGGRPPRERSTRDWKRSAHAGVLPFLPPGRKVGAASVGPAEQRAKSRWPATPATRTSPLAGLAEVLHLPAALRARAGSLVGLGSISALGALEQIRRLVVDRVVLRRGLLFCHAKC